MSKLAEKFRLNKNRQKYLFIFLAGTVFAIACFLLINLATEPFSKSQYCGSCHEMESVYKAWKTSIHYSNPSGTVTQCIDCHLPAKDNFFVFNSAKAYYGAKDIYKHYFGPAYDIKQQRLKVLKKMSNQRCLNCHASLMSKPISPVASRIAHQQYFNQPADPNVQSCMSCHYGPQLFHWRTDLEELKK